MRDYDSRMISTNHLFSPGQLQVVHEKVQTQKEHYLNYRKFILDDDSDIFASGTSKATKASARAGRTSLASVGPPPFGSTFAQKSTMASIFTALQATQTPASAQTQVRFDSHRFLLRRKLLLFDTADVVCRRCLLCNHRGSNFANEQLCNALR